MIGLLSIPTWIIHFGSVIEWGVAMALFYMVGRYKGNVWFKQMPLFMLPYGLSGLCAIAFHLTEDTATFFNDAQAYLTLTGSCAFALWAWLLLRDLTKVKAQKSQTHASSPVKTKGKLIYTLRQAGQSQLSELESPQEEVRRG